MTITGDNGRAFSRLVNRRRDVILKVLGCIDRLPEADCTTAFKALTEGDNAEAFWQAVNKEPDLDTEPDDYGNSVVGNLTIMRRLSDSARRLPKADRFDALMTLIDRGPLNRQTARQGIGQDQGIALTFEEKLGMLVEYLHNRQALGIVKTGRIDAERLGHPGKHRGTVYLVPAKLLPLFPAADGAPAADDAPPVAYIQMGCFFGTAADLKKRWESGD